MQTKTRGFSWLLSLFGGVFGQTGLAADEPAEQTLYGGGSQQSFKGPEAYFTGEVQVQMLFPDNATAHYSGAYVTFQPGARTAWHLHPAGQHMVVTSGVALTGTRDGKVIEFDVGDTVWCPANIDHWHGATPDAPMTHLVITGSRDARMWFGRRRSAMRCTTVAVSAHRRSRSAFRRCRQPNRPSCQSPHHRDRRC
ncbi:MAG: cupin domain-containing protein [Thiohalocapsa sp.]|uniref:cupin domain-containing protein n=1 Tax=Thiohalocapsa sp. TaxID=2497641 RepID=UPI0025E99D37|nr:cupin domain-containing protein [Thiohalocapsa sp.]MCG6942650.1 cupin domain-containing protein [Thiohalocapsa sp.]